MSTVLDELKAHCSQQYSLLSIRKLLGWDAQIQMPSKGSARLNDQEATLMAFSHQLATDSRIPEWLATLESTQELLNPIDQILVTKVRQEHQKYSKLPTELVSRLSQVMSNAGFAWAEAMKTNSFSVFSPHLNELVVLSREEANCLGYEGSIYNACLNKYEPGCTKDTVNHLFDQLRPSLIELTRKIKASAIKISSDCLQQAFPIDEQEAFNIHLLRAMGFDFEAGKIARARHPFCTCISPYDVRLAIHYNEQSLNEGLFLALHEGGHALYEQGINPDLFGTPLCGGTSTGLHESQSRLWENLVGRSLTFWQAFYPDLQTMFPKQLNSVDLTSFYGAINAAEPSLIRLNADEVTYNLHIMLRTELEIALIEGNLDVTDLPTAWNDKMKDYLGIMPKTDREGCLQDPHWAKGSFGYFPTYTLGNVYAAQLIQAAEEQIPELNTLIAKGQLLALRNWLKENIHWAGKSENAETICQRVCGEALNPQPFLNYLTTKYSDLYGLS